MSYKIRFLGLVQGVGFRPLVYKIAKDLGLFGEVYNDSYGVVLILACSKDRLDIFIKNLKAKLPPLARIDELKISEFKGKAYKSFEIIASKEALKKTAILSDFALCKDCEREFYDKFNKRYKYPFITCTNCGPRYSIITSLPYDRCNTTMKELKLCKDCELEYKDPLNRRFHAQPISCKACKISVFLKDKEAKILYEDEEAIKKAAKLLKNGKILAFKNIGGFHLLCKGDDEKSVLKLRQRKNRPSKPFALLCKNIAMVKKYAFLNPHEEELLKSIIRPIVLLKSKDILKNIGKYTNKIGIMLPSSPLQLLLFEYFSSPLVATSANISGESIIYEEKKLAKLKNIYDYYIDYDRAIHNSSDDSIVQSFDNQMMVLRSARGLNPAFLEYKNSFKEEVLALGAELKNQFVLYFKESLCISPYIGDLKAIDTQERLKKNIRLFTKTYDIKPSIFLADKHPNFYYTKDFSPLFRINHHYAHFCAALFENKHFKKALGFAFDGTGYGDDASIWGGEIFLGDLSSYERIAHFDDFLLINTDIKNISYLALATIFHYDLEKEAKVYLKNFNNLENIKKVYKKASLKTSSLGRIIDAFAALVFGIKSLEYEGMAGLLIEKYYDEELAYSYKLILNKGKISFKSIIIGALKDDKKRACTAFLNGLASFICDFSQAFDEEVFLCGGVFQNLTLLKILKKRGFSFKLSLKYPINDSSIALGQMIHFLNIKNKEKICAKNADAL